MAAPGHVVFGADGTFQSTCLHFEGFPAILWDTLRWFGYQSPPLYSGRLYVEQGIQTCQVQALVPPPFARPDWPSLGIIAYGLSPEDTWESAALQLLTQFCQFHPVEITLDPIGLFSVRSRLDPAWLDRIGNLEVLATTCATITISTNVRCMAAFYRLIELQGRAMTLFARTAVDTHGYLQAARRDLVGQTYQLIQRGIQIHDMQDRISELEGEVADLVDGMIELSEEKMEVEMELAVANAHLEEHQAELEDMHALNMQLEAQEDPEEDEGASSMDIEEDGAPSPTHSVQW